jgi:CBS domain-containing protein
MSNERSLMEDQPDEIRPKQGALQRVAWTRGDGCADVANLLAGGRAMRIEGDLRATCIRERIDTVVSRKLSSFDLVPVVAPQSVDVDNVEQIAAAVGSGPHSPFAVAVAARLGITMGVPALAASVYRSDDARESTVQRLESLAAPFPSIQTRAVRGDSAVHLTESLEPATLLVVGAPGGSWFQRQIFGPGHRLAVHAPSGVLVVRTAEPRCFHMAANGEGAIAGPHLSVTSARQIIHDSVIAVAEGGVLIGVVRSEELEDLDGDLQMQDIMHRPVSVGATEPIAAIAEVREYFGNGSIPVIDDAGKIVGMIPVRA